MPEIKFKRYKQEEYKENMRRLLADKGLYDAVKYFCDKINDDVSDTGYLVHMSVLEYMNNILYLIELNENKEEADLEFEGYLQYLANPDAPEFNDI
jgi:hypothetical protein